jgi:hypothetical protein
MEERLVQERGCGYPKPGGVYLESIGNAGGTLPAIVVLVPPIPVDHFHRGWVYVDLSACIAAGNVQYVGASVQSAEDYKLRAGMDKIARDVFGNGARVKQGQVTRFHDAAFRVLESAGWQPDGTAAAMQARAILRAQASALAPMVDVKE